MFLETFHDEALGHLSYMVGDGGQAAVIDPRRDVDVYLEAAARRRVRIEHILETHRNEDYVVGSRELQVRTGATIHHGPHTPFQYGQVARQGQRFELGQVHIEVHETPGHTDDSLSFVVYDHETSDEPVGVFTGDALLVGDVGRTDFDPSRAVDMAAMLYESLFDRLLMLGDDTLVWPAHGAGSVCGSGMASRVFSTIGHERRHNAALQVVDRDGFVQRKLQERHDMPPYFSLMEALNTSGPEVLGGVPYLQPVDVARVVQYVEQGQHLVVDVREPEAVCGAHVPGSVAIPMDMLATYAGWFLPYDQNLLFVVGGELEPEDVARRMIRLGFERLDGYLAGGMRAWETSGRGYGTFRAVHVEEVAEKLHAGVDGWRLLDVRSPEEHRAGRLAGALHVPIKGIQDGLGGLDPQVAYTVFCGSGRRALVVASLLRRAGFGRVEVCLGSMRAAEEVGVSVVGEREVEVGVGE